MGLSKTPIKLSELARKWDKKESDLIGWLATGKIEAYFWYEGFVISTGAIVLKQGDYRRFFGWVAPDSSELEPLQNNTRVKLTIFRQFDPFLPPHKAPQGFNPATIGGDDFLKKTHYTITPADLFIMSTEVARLEDEDDELTREKLEQHAVEESGEEIQPTKKEEKTKNNSTFYPAEKKSLLKMIIGMAERSYKYKLEDNKSDVPAKIVNAVEIAGLSIEADTVREWLKKAAEMRDEILLEKRT